MTTNSRNHWRNLAWDRFWLNSLDIYWTKKYWTNFTRIFPAFPDSKSIVNDVKLSTTVTFNCLLYLVLLSIIGTIYCYTLSPLILIASFILLSINVTLFAWIVHRFASSKRPIKYASEASWIASNAVAWKLYFSRNNFPVISLTSRWKGNFWNNKSDLCW